jgi:hypothetical protein
MNAAGTDKSKFNSLKADEELREEMWKRQQERRANEQNEQQDLNQGMAAGTHSSAHGGIRWDASYRMRSKIEQGLPTEEQGPPRKWQIEARAYELYLQRECQDGRDLQDWFIAENELKHNYDQTR